MPQQKRKMRLSRRDGNSQVAERDEPLVDEDLVVDDNQETNSDAEDTNDADTAATEEEAIEEATSEERSEDTAETEEANEESEGSGEEPIDGFQQSRLALEVPYATDSLGYAVQHLQAKLSRRQARTLSLLRSALSESGARVEYPAARHPEGKVVDTEGDAVRWLLDTMAREIESEHPEALRIE